MTAPWLNASIYIQSSPLLAVGNKVYAGDIN